jgi:hypothetical protein
VASGADTLWHRSTLTIVFAASDGAGGSGVADVGYRVDAETTWRSLGYPTYNALRFAPPADHSFDGVHTLWYRAADVAGNIEMAKSVTLKFDTRGPSTTAPVAAGARHGARATLRYRVNDALSAKATVTIRIQTLKGRAVKTLVLGRRTTNRLLSSSLICTMAPGRYRFLIYAKDLAGNPQTKLGVNRLTVR